MPQFVAPLRNPVAVAVLLAVSATMLSACGGSRDDVLSEKVARAESAAQRAELAQQAAERAAQAVSSRSRNATAELSEVSNGGVPIDDSSQAEASPSAEENDSSHQNPGLASAMNVPPA